MLIEADEAKTMILMFDEVTRLSTRLRSLFAGARAPSGLSPMEAMVLSAVVQAPTPPTVPKIGRSLGHPRQVVQRAANSLIASGLITIAPNPEHKRAPLLLATADGKSLKALTDTRAIAAANALLRVVDPDKCARLTEEIRVLRHEIEEHLRSKPAEA